MTKDNKGIRFVPQSIADLNYDQAYRLHMAVELLMGVLSELGWTESVLYEQLSNKKIRLVKALEVLRR